MSVTDSIIGTTTPAVSPAPGRLQKLKETLSILLRSRIALVGIFLFGFWVVVAIFADNCIVQPACWVQDKDFEPTPWLAIYSPLEQIRGDQFRPPCIHAIRGFLNSVISNPDGSDEDHCTLEHNQHILGTDRQARDLWSRLAYGSRTILTLAPLSVLIALVIGGMLGLIAGYYGGYTDEIIMRILDAMMSFPQILLYLVIISALGPNKLNIMIAITIAGAPGIARLVRGLTLDIKTRDYIAAAQTRGEHPFYIMLVEILPSARGPIIIDATLRIGYAVFAIGTLGFLGLGLPPPSPDWGSIISAGRKFIQAGHPWDALWASIAIAMVVVGLNMIADGLSQELQRYR